MYLRRKLLPKSVIFINVWLLHEYAHMQSSIVGNL